MKVTNKYFKNRKSAITALLNKKRNISGVSTIHEVRVEIKKLKSFVKLIESCSSDFNRKKAIKPFLEFFKLAGAVRELQIEQIILEKYDAGVSLNAYRIVLKRKLMMAIDAYASFFNSKQFLRIKKRFKLVEVHLDTVNRKNSKRYIRHMRQKILELLLLENFMPLDLHKFRRRLQHYNYLLSFPGSGKEAISSGRIKTLSNLIGKWHDLRKVIRNLNLILTSGQCLDPEKAHLEIFRSKLEVDSELLFQQINGRLRSGQEL